MFIYDHKDSVKLFDIMYKKAQNGLFLDRKYRRFLEGLREAEHGKGTGGVASIT